MRKHMRCIANGVGCGVECPVTNWPCSSDKHSAPDKQNFAGRLRGVAAFLASNYTALSPDEAQVLVRALESAADHVEAFFAPSAEGTSTPRTDKAARRVNYMGEDGECDFEAVTADFSRQLERELYGAKVDEFRRSLDEEHAWAPDGDELRFESHPGCEAPHVHTTCKKCGARAWFTEQQWGLLSMGCSTPSHEGSIPYIDRSEAVNLARNVVPSAPDYRPGEHQITPKGIRCLAEAVLKMDEAIRCAGSATLSREQQDDAACKRAAEILRSEIARLDSPRAMFPQEADRISKRQDAYREAARYLDPPERTVKE